MFCCCVGLGRRLSWNDGSVVREEGTRGKRQLQPCPPVHTFPSFGCGIAVRWVGTGRLLSALIKKKQKVLGG